MQKLEEAQESDLLVCGMQLFDADDLMHGVIVTRDGLESYHPMEFEYYNFRIVASCFNANLCAYCAGASGSEGLVDEDLTPLWKTVLPFLCHECRAGGPAPLARYRRRNGTNNERRAQRARLETLVIPHLPNEDVASVKATSGVATNNVNAAISHPRVIRCGRQNPPTNGLARSRRPNVRRTR